MNKADQKAQDQGQQHRPMLGQAEQFLLEFHRAQPGCTSQAFSPGRCKSHGKSSYGLLTDAIAEGGLIVDLGCGDGYLLQQLQERFGAGQALAGIDFSPEELQLASGRQLSNCRLDLADAWQLPFESSSVSTCVSHFAFHIMSRVDEVVEEITRVLVPGGSFVAVVGGGPKLGDAFEVFVELALTAIKPGQAPPRLGDMRARTSTGLEELFAPSRGFSAPKIDDHAIDLSGPFEQVWNCLATIYDLAHFDERQRSELKTKFRDACRHYPELIPCSMLVRRVVCSYGV